MGGPVPPSPIAVGLLRRRTGDQELRAGLLGDKVWVDVTSTSPQAEGGTGDYLHFLLLPLPHRLRTERVMGGSMVGLGLVAQDKYRCQGCKSTEAGGGLIPPVFPRL